MDFNRIFRNQALQFKSEGDDWEIIERRLFDFADAVYKGQYNKDNILNGIRLAREALGEVVRLQRGNSISVDGHENWFDISQSEEIKTSFWSTYKQNLFSNGWDERTINAIRLNSQAIVNYLKPPDNNHAPSKKGLVLGYVQSGKTASMAGVITMYADAGCKLVIVLSGIHNNLRLQTENRLRNDLGINDTHNWNLITEGTDKITAGALNLDAYLTGDKPVIGVFKKQTHILKYLINYIKQSNLITSKTVLIIDDECDQAGVNTKDITVERSRINELLVNLFHSFHHKNYIGYTATPFANILNEPPGKDSLYPEDFIYNLPLPETYFGSARIFGRQWSGEENEDENGLSIHNIIEEEDNNILRADLPHIPDSLKESVLYFLLATSVKYARGLNDKHSSMLIHFSQKVGMHRRISDLLKVWLKEQITNIKKENKDKINELKKIWIKQSDKINNDILNSVFPDYYPDDIKLEVHEVPFEEIIQSLPLVLDRVQVKTDNGSAAQNERAIYSDEPAVYIVVGGNTLSRGLTLEGLVVSYFIRSARTYDALLQMGRWFGYRHGYEDLPRIWIAGQLYSNFQYLSNIEEEIRETINQNYGFDKTPKDIGVKVRTHPQLNIVRTSAMQGTTNWSVSYSGERPQTTFFSVKDEDILKMNRDAGETLLNNCIDKKMLSKTGRIIYSDIPYGDIERFLNNYQVNSRNKGFEKNSIKDYIRRAQDLGYLNNWNVVLMQGADKNNEDYFAGNKVKLVNRSRLTSSDDEIENAYIKALISKNDILADVDRSLSSDDMKSILASSAGIKNKTKITSEDLFILRNVLWEGEVPGLLLLYPIDKDSDSNKGERGPLNAVEHVLGISIIFPSIHDENLYDAVVMDLSSVSESEELTDDEYEEEE